MLSVELGKELTTIPERLNIYSTITPKVDRAVFVKVLDQLERMGDFYQMQWKDYRNWKSARNKDFRLAINGNTGAVRIWNQLDKFRDDGLSFSIADPEIEFIGKRYVEKHRLSPEFGPVEKRGIFYSWLQTSSPEGKVSEPKKLDATIVFGRKIDNIPVNGPGGVITAKIEADESVSAVRVFWRKLGPVKEAVRTIQPDQALRLLDRALRKKGVNTPVIIENPELCYFEYGPSDLQPFIEPAYLFIYESKPGTVNTPFKSIEVIPACEKTFLTWQLPKRY